MFAKVNSLHQQLQQLHNQNQIHLDTQNSIREKWIVDWTYHSNAIEGNQLTLLETRVVLESGITIGGKSLKDHLEAIDHKEAILFIEELAQQETKLSEVQLKQIHSIVLRRIRPQDAGQYRQVPVTVGDHLPPQPWEVPMQMERLLTQYHQALQSRHTLEQAAFLHCEFIRIHPFIDGNGRTARLIMNLELLKKGFSPIVLPVEQRLPYYQALQTFDDTGEIDPFLQLIIPLATQSLTFYLTACGYRPEKGQ